MKKTYLRNALIIAAVLIFTGTGIVLAHDEWGGRGGYGGHMMGYGGGYGGHMMGYGGGYGGPMMGPGYGQAYSDLSQEDYQKLEAANEKFFDQTRDLREKLDEKRFALDKEWNQENPDSAKIKALQDDISKLRSEFDAKRMEHELEVRKMMPESFRGRTYAGGYRGGYCQ
jgi:Spy/CpxP family protein refolding chaperone